MDSANTLIHPRPSRLVHDAIPFGTFGVPEIRAALVAGMQAEDEEMAAITHSPAPPTFENTIVAFERAGALLSKAEGVMYNLLSAETSDELDALAEEMSPRLSRHHTQIVLNAALFARIKEVHDSPQARQLRGEDARLLDEVYQSFVRAGAGLDPEAAARLSELESELSTLKLRFSQHLLRDTNERYLHLTNEAELAGLPEMHCQAAAEAARKRGLTGWVITLQAPSYRPFMTHAERRDLRERLYRLYHTRCSAGGTNDNSDVVRDIARLRLAKARLLGFQTYAEYVVQRRMAESVENVEHLLSELVAHYRERAEGEVEAVRAEARAAEGADFELMPWDFDFYAHRLGVRTLDFDPEALRPYFALGRVEQGIFALAQRLYGLTFRARPDIPVYHPDVRAFDVVDADGSFLGVLYMDLFPRQAKQGGAWMTSYKEQQDYMVRPHVSVVANLTPPTAGQPALLTHGEVETLLHEFGHALHGLFANTRYESLSGTNVYWDFVELPSQLMENFAYEGAFLASFATHYQTDEPLPEALTEKICRARRFNAAYACMRQVAFAKIDMCLHSLRQPLHSDLATAEREALQDVRLLPHVEGCCMATQFSHIMSGGYAAGYYSYKWAEVLDADAFQQFRENGFFDANTAARFRDSVLSLGGTCQPMELYERFRGRRPSIDAMLRRDGILREEVPAVAQ